MVDKTLLNFDNCDIFTPDVITKRMQGFLHETGSLLDPCVGTGNLLSGIVLEKYSSVDVFDIKQRYLDSVKLDGINLKSCSDFLTRECGKTYDNIIVNPPYIRYQDLSTDYRRMLQEKWPSVLNNGNIDIYFAFILKCIEALSIGGVMVAITPNSYLYNKCATQLRGYIVKNRLIDEIIDFKSEKVFPGVSTYCCISVFRKREKCPETFVLNEKTIKFDDVLKSPTFSFHVRETYDENEVTLGEVCDIRNGLATLRDKIFINDEKLFDESCWEEITTGRKSKYVIYPYKDGKIIDESIFKKSNPQTYKYLEGHKDELAKRDKGNKKYEAWYAYGRRQSIVKGDTMRALFIPTFVDPKSIVHKIESNKLHVSCIKLTLKKEGYTYESIMNAINNFRVNLEEMSPKRGGGWISLSSTSLKKVPIKSLDDQT